MAEALVSLVVEQLVSVMSREPSQKVRLVVGEEVKKLESNLTAIKAVLADAETRLVKEATVSDWLVKLKDVAYDIEDVLDDWEVAFLDSQSKPGDEQDLQRPHKKPSKPEIENESLQSQRLMKVVLKLDLLDNKATQKAMKKVSGISGIHSISLDKEHKLTVIGVVDPLVVVRKLRKLCDTEIVTVGPAKEEKVTDKEEKVTDIVTVGPAKEEVTDIVTFRPAKEKVRSALESTVSFGKKVVSLGKQVGRHHDLAKKIKELNGELDLLAQQKERYLLVPTKETQQIERPMTISMIGTTEVKSREEDENRLVNMLLSEASDGDGSDLRVYSLVGTGGIGKTTLAQFAFNDVRVDKYFDQKIWICVSDPFNETSIAKAILESLLGNTPNLTILENLLQKIRQSVEKRKILLIMDDVWEEDPTKWNQLKQSLRSASPKSKVLVTTRSEKVANVMGCYNDDILKIGILSDEDCWAIVSKIAFSGRRDAEYTYLEAIGREISKKCKGLPLATKAIGGILQFRKTREGWQSILDDEIWKVDEAQRDIFALLLLSYNDLSPVLKRCFSYCAIFPKDFVIEKKMLIELWMAQGYLKEGGSDNLEIIGENYFQNLAMRSFFQDFGYCDGRITHCKMHDMVHDLAQLVAREECLCVPVNSQVESIMGYVSRKVRHLSLECTPSSSDSSTSSFISFDGTKKMRSLLIRGLQLTTEDLSRLFSESTHVRSLSLKSGDFAEIPPSISKLVKLRWLDLSKNDELKQLPETLCELHSLETIDVSWCRILEKLPRGIGKLINLRHLHNGGIGGPRRLPKGIGQLTGLRTLEVVDVGCHDDEDDAFSLGDLKNLNQLWGSLKIKNLGACNRHVGEVMQAELKKKEHITELVLSFSGSRGEEEEEELLLEALEPSPNLEILYINYYGGTIFPGWMISLMNLRSIGLYWCQSCEHLPSLGKLPCLETLCLDGMSSVKKVGQELLGIETQIGDSKSETSASTSSSSSSSPVVVAFPKLTTLKFDNMPSWEEWEDYYNDNYDGTAKPPIIIMPSLLSLKIGYCRRLKALPDYILQNTTLHILEIGEECNLLEERYNKEKGEDWSKISHILGVKIFRLRPRKKTLPPALGLKRKAIARRLLNIVRNRPTAGTTEGGSRVKIL